MSLQSVFFVCKGFVCAAEFLNIRLVVFFDGKGNELAIYKAKAVLKALKLCYLSFSLQLSGLR